MIHKSAIIETDQIGENVDIKEYVIIRKGAVIGNNVIIHPFSIIEESVVVGNDVEIFPCAYIGKKPKGPGLANKPTFDKFVKIGDFSVIGPNVVVNYGVLIGENCLISDNVSIRENCSIGNNSIIGRQVTINFGTTIGSNTRIMDLSHITARSIVEENVFIGPGVSSADDDSMGRGENYNPLEDKGPLIMKGASIGEGCVILPKVTIEEGAVVGALLINSGLPNSRAISFNLLIASSCSIYS